jgi:hypothetical protein
LCEKSVLGELVCVKPIDSSTDYWASATTYSDSVAKFPVEVVIPGKPTLKTQHQIIICPRCGCEYKAEIRSRITIIFSWIWNAILWTAWAIPLLFVVVGMIRASIRDGDIAVLILLVPFGFLYLILPTYWATLMTANLGRVTFTDTRNLGVAGHYLWRR